VQTVERSRTRKQRADGFFIPQSPAGHQRQDLQSNTVSETQDYSRIVKLKVRTGEGGGFDSRRAGRKFRSLKQANLQAILQVFPCANRGGGSPQIMIVQATGAPSRMAGLNCQSRMALKAVSLQTIRAPRERPWPRSCAPLGKRLLP